jgi:DNA-binding response OmpR family regulator
VRLLLVEDDRALADELQPILEARGYAVDRSHDGEDALYLGQTEDYDLVILDLGLPRIGGIPVLEEWGASGGAQAGLVLTARDTWREKVLGLKAGADDYLAKPFHPEELLARLDALVRRAHGRAAPGISSQAFSLDEDRQSVLRADGARVVLTGTEFRLLRYFMLNQGKLLSKTLLTEHVYDQDFDLDSNVIEVYVRRLREKLGKEIIETRRGQGYVFRG